MKKIEPIVFTAKEPPSEEEPKRVAPLFTTTELPHPKVFTPPPDQPTEVKPLFANSIPAAHFDPHAPVVPVVLAMSGMKVRRRWEPTVEDLQKFLPVGISDIAACMLQARGMVRDTNTDTETFEEWGLQYQKHNAACADRVFHITTDPLIQKVLDGMKSIATMVDYGSSRWHSSTDAMVVQKTAELRVDIFKCEVLRDQLPGIVVELEEIALALSASNVAGSYLLTVTPEGSPRTTLDKRLSSIAITSLSNGQLRLQIGLLQKSMAYRAQTVTDVLVNLIPNWCTNRSLQPDRGKPLTQHIIAKLRGES